MLSFKSLIFVKFSALSTFFYKQMHRIYALVGWYRKPFLIATLDLGLNGLTTVFCL